MRDILEIEKSPTFKENFFRYTDLRNEEGLIFCVKNEKGIDIAISRGSDIDARNRWNDTPLISLCQRNVDVKTIKVLLERGANVNAVNVDGDNAIFGLENIETLKLLVEYGVDFFKVNNYGALATFYASKKEIIEFLLKLGLNVNHQSDEGDTALIYADTEEVLQTLLDNGADPYLKNKHGEDAFIAHANQPKMLAILEKSLIKDALRPQIAKKSSKKMKM